MGLYLYCLGAHDHPEPRDTAGLEGAPVAPLRAADLLAWVSELSAAPAASLARIREHNHVVERACAERTALPVRFGQWFPDAAALGQELDARRAALAERLAAVDGALEMGVRVIDPARSAELPDRSSGRAYLEALAQRESAARAERERGAAIARELAAWIGPLVRDTRVRLLGTAAGLVAVAHLVDRHDIGGYAARAREFAPRHGDLRFLFSGPWPPYGFADDEREDPG